jgi:hypothetical protein
MLAAISRAAPELIFSIDILSLFVYYAFKVLAGSGSGEPSLNWQ